MRRGRSRIRPRGWTLVEVMVAMLIGLITCAAAMAALAAMGSAARHGSALIEMSDNATIAAAILREHLSLAGYRRPVGLDDRGRFARSSAGAAVFACEAGFVSAREAFDALACNAAGGREAPGAIAIVHEADGVNTLMSADGLPLDCLGSGIPLSGTDSGTIHLADTRFFVAAVSGSKRKELYCKGSGAAAAQALVEGIEDLRFVFGVTTPSGVAWRHAGQMARGEWAGVIAVRFCLLATSAGEVAPQSQRYTDCGGTLVTAGDRRLYRTSVTTVVLPNGAGGRS